MTLIGGKWKVQILCAISNGGSLRYNALRAKLDGISNTVLAGALKELERDGLIQRHKKHFTKMRRRAKLDSPQSPYGFCKPRSVRVY